MLIIFITSISISLTVYLVFLSSNGETVNDRKKDNLSLFNSESKLISSMEGLEQASKNRLIDEREILFLQDTVGKRDIGFVGRRKSFSIALGVMSLFITLSIYFYPLNLGSYSELENAKVFESFFNGSKEQRLENKELFKKSYVDYIDKNADKSNHIYTLAKSLKDLEEFKLSRLAYRSLFINHREDLSGDILAEYTQVLYFSAGREITEQVKKLLVLTLLKNPDNPIALTLKGLQYLGEKNLEQTIIQWTKAASFITNEREKGELEMAIKALNNRKNQ
jgi:cytochrome c-type biogenesis protein CcmH/NrfG